MSSGRLGPPSRAPSCRRRRNDASPPGPDSRSTALPMTACSQSGPGRSHARRRAAARPAPRTAGPGPPARPRSTSPVTIGAIAASQATAPAASPSSHAPPSLPPSDAAARCAAHRARTCAVHSSCRAELPSSRIRSASEMCAQTLTGCPARSGSRLASRPAGACGRCDFASCLTHGRHPGRPGASPAQGGRVRPSERDLRRGGVGADPAGPGRRPRGPARLDRGGHLQG